MAARRAARPRGGRFLHHATVLAAASSVLLSACAPEATYHAPRLGFFGQYAGRPGAPVLLTNAEWWRRFNDPALNQLVAEALAGNLSLAAARERVVQARAEARSLAADASVTSSIGARAESQTGGSTQRLAEGELGLGWLLDPWGGRRAARNAARAKAEAAVAEADAARLLVLYNLCNAYVDLRYQQRLLSLRQQEIASRRRTVDMAQGLIDAKSGTRLELTRTQAQLAEAQAQVPLIEAQIRIQQNQIAVLAGRHPGSAGPERGAARAQPLAAMPSDIGIPADLLRNRPDIRIAERLYYAALEQVTATKASLYPSLSLTGAITLDAIRKGGHYRESYFGPTLQLPALPTDATKAAVEADRSAAAQALIDWKSTVLNAVMEVENALQEYDGSRRARAAAERSTSLYRQSQTMTRDMAGSGEATLGDLIDVEQEVTRSADTLADTLRQQGLSFVALNVRLGSGSGDQPPAAPNATAIPAPAKPGG